MADRPTVSPAVRRVRFKAYLSGAVKRLKALADSNAALTPNLPSDGDTINRALARHGHSAQPGLKVPLLGLQEILSYVPPPAEEARQVLNEQNSGASRATMRRPLVCNTTSGKGRGAKETCLGRLVETCALSLHLIIENESTVQPMPLPSEVAVAQAAAARGMLRRSSGSSYSSGSSLDLLAMALDSDSSSD